MQSRSNHDCRIKADEAPLNALSIDLVVNEFCIFGDMLEAEGQIEGADAAYAEAADAADCYGSSGHQAKVAIDRAARLQKRAAYVQSLSLLYAARDDLMVRPEIRTPRSMRR